MFQSTEVTYSRLVRLINVNISMVLKKVVEEVFSPPDCSVVILMPRTKSALLWLVRLLFDHHDHIQSPGSDDTVSRVFKVERIFKRDRAPARRVMRFA